MTSGQKKRERKNRRIARVGSGTALLLLLILWAFPFMSMSSLDSEEARQRERKQIVVNFAQEKVKKFEETRSKMIASEAAQKSEVAEPAPSSAPPQEISQPKAAPTELPATPSKPVVTAPTEGFKMPSFSEFFKDKPLADKPSEAALPEEDTGEDELAWADEVGEEAPVSGNGSDVNSNNTSGTGSKETGGGSPNPGKGEGGNGVAPASYSWGDGKGLNDFRGFGRKLIYNPPNSEKRKLTGQNGRITLKICVDGSGKVSVAEALEKGTTIKDAALLKETERVLKLYKFDEDNTPQQCGRFYYNLTPVVIR